MHLGLRRKFVDIALACVGLSNTAGITIMMLENHPKHEIIVLPEDRGKYLALEGGIAQRWRGLTLFLRITLPQPAVLPIGEPDDENHDAAPCLVEACCEPDALSSRRTR